MSKNPVKRFIFLPLFFALPMDAAWAACEPDVYFSESDYAHTTPLATPSREFADDMRSAKAGNRTGQRNIAVSYETGYLVAKCDEKAAYWYAKAAKGGDAVAAKWIAERDMLDKMATGPSCIGASCDADGDDGSSPTSFSIGGSHGHFLANVTINGVTVVGLIDTGASTLAMSPATAHAMGITGEGFHFQRSITANGGVVALDKVIPHVKIGPLTVTNVEISVMPRLSITLIGASVLRQLKMSTANETMTLSK